MSGGRNTRKRKKTRIIGLSREKKPLLAHPTTGFPPEKSVFPGRKVSVLMEIMNEGHRENAIALERDAIDAEAQKSPSWKIDTFLKIAVSNSSAGLLAIR